MKTQQISRNEFIRKFNKLDSQSKTALLLKAGMRQERINEELGNDLKSVEISEISDCFDNDLVCDIWSIMEESQLIENNKKERLAASQDYKNGKIDLFTYGQILNNITYAEEAQGIEY